MTTCIYVDGMIVSDSKVTSGTDINPVYFKKTYAVEGELMGQKLIGCAIAGNAMRKTKFLQWLAGGAKQAEFVPYFQTGLQALVLTEEGAWIYFNGEFLEAWDGVAIGSGGAKATAKFNTCKQMNIPCSAWEAIDAALCPTSGDSCSGGMKQFISRTSKGTTAMPATVDPAKAEQFMIKP